jgi:hypothetical protein
MKMMTPIKQHMMPLVPLPFPLMAQLPPHHHRSKIQGNLPRKFLPKHPSPPTPPKQINSRNVDPPSSPPPARKRNYAVRPPRKKPNAKAYPWAPLILKMLEITGSKWSSECYSHKDSN